METCCQLCGVLGCPELLVYCSKCSIYAQHRYCLDKIPSSEEVDVYWLCEQCNPGFPKNASLGNPTLDQETTEITQNYQDHKSNSDDSSTTKSQHYLRHNAAVVVLSKKSHRSVSSSSEINGTSTVPSSSCLSQKEDENHMDTSSEYTMVKSKRKRRLVLDDEEEDGADVQLQRDHIDHRVCKEKTLQVSEPVLQSSSPEYGNGSSKSSLHEIQDRLPIASIEMSDLQDLGHVETSDISKDGPDSFDVNGTLRAHNSSGMLQKQVQDGTDASDCCKDKKRRNSRRLILDDEDDAGGELHSDHFGQDACNKSTLQMNESVQISSSSENGRGSVLSSPRENPDMGPLASNEIIDMEDLGQEEISDVLEDGPDSFDGNGASRTKKGSGWPQKQVENSTCTHIMDNKEKMKRKQRRKLILNDADEADGEFQSDPLDHDACNKSTLQVKDMNKKGHTRQSLFDECTKVKNMKRSSRKFILDDEDEANEEVQSDHLNCDVGHKSTLRQSLFDECTKVKNTKRSSREFILDDENEANEEVQTDHLNCDVGHKSTLRPSLFDERTKVKNTKRSSRKFILDDEDEANEEVQSDHLNCDVGHKSTLQVNEPTLQSSSKHVQKPNNQSADEIPNIIPIADDEVLDMQDMRLAKICDAQLVSASLHTTNVKPYYSPARPIVNPVWRGFFNICNEEYGPLRAHLSTRACEKVWEIAKLLPTALHIEKLPRLEAWPNSFKVSPPTDDNIALFFLSDDNARAESMLDRLLDDIINRDLVLKIIFDEAELLVFSSIVLPEDYHRFQGKYYPWGVFRRRQVPVPIVPENCFSKTNGLTEDRHESGASNQTEAESNDDAVPQENSIGSGNGLSTSKRFKLFGFSVPVDSISAVSNGEISLGAVWQNENAAPFSESLKLFGSDVGNLPSERPTILKELAFEQPAMTNETEVHHEYFGISRRREVATKCHDSYFEIFPTEAEGDMLDLFPVRGENTSMLSRVEHTSDLDLKLTSWR